MMIKNHNTGSHVFFSTLKNWADSRGVGRFYKVRVFVLCMVAFVAIDSCVEPVVIKLDSDTPQIVVDGLLTNEPGPYTVTLSYSYPAQQPSKTRLPVTGANLEILEDNQNVFSLLEKEPGVYESDGSWQAQFGKTYQLRIVTKAGNEFISNPQTLRHPGEIGSLKVIFEPGGIVLLDDGSLIQDALNIYVDGIKTDATVRLRWKHKGIFHLITYPELRVDYEGRPMPHPCSGYINDNDELVKVGECTCCDCWATDVTQNLALENWEVNASANATKVLVAKMPATSLKFIRMYYLEVEQMSLTEEVFTFWRFVKSLQSSAGNIFLPNAIKVRGNIKAVNSDEEILGIFSVSGIARKDLFIEPSVIPYELLPDIRTEPCYDIFEKSTTEKPAFWPY